MAATLLNTQSPKISAIGTLTTATPDTANGNVWSNTGREILHIVTAGASGITATITPLGKLLGAIPVSSPSYVVGASAYVALGPFDPGTYNQNTSGSVVAGSGQVAVSWSGSSGTVTVWVEQYPAASL